ncbi:MAG: insulinase family protein [Alphaproteobacteria bacterium]|nr:insulinase family protein [Alphaproteobacteria bacterium]
MTVRTTRLPSGLSVVSDAMPDFKTAAIGVWIDAGARNETPEINGVAHLLEHMAFKGTERRSARAIAEEIEAVGGHLNAYTSREQTAYYARILSGDMALGLDILADILQHSTFAEDELERERQVVIQEIGQADDTPDDIIFDFLQEQAYPGQPIGRPILGTEALVSAMGRDQLQGFMARHYQAPRMVVAAAGGIDHDEVVALVENAFGALPARPGEAREAARYVGGEHRDTRDLEQVHVALAFAGLPFLDPDFHALQVYSTLMGGGMSSRLFQEVREKRGLAYSIFSFASSYMDSGLFTIYAGTGENDVAELMPVIAGEMQAATGDLAEAEIARARAQLKAGLLMSMESPSSRAEQLARQMLIFGRPLPLDEIIARVDAVSLADVERVAARILRGGQPTLAALGPIGRLEAYERIAARFA